MINHPSIQGRQLVLVGGYNEARTWVERHDIDVDHVIIAGAARQIVALDPPNVHLIVLPSARHWRNPHFFMLRTELSFMHAKGATLEWA
jgi:hypothetical protein